jgi:hypothetical protein
MVSSSEVRADRPRHIQTVKRIAARRSFAFDQTLAGGDSPLMQRSSPSVTTGDARREDADDALDTHRVSALPRPSLPT